MTTELTPELAATIQEGFARRDRANMGPTIAFFEKLLDLLAVHEWSRPARGGIT